MSDRGKRQMQIGFVYQHLAGVMASLGKEEGQALSEYSITLVLLVVVTIAAITSLGVSIVDLLQNAADLFGQI